MIAVNLDRVTVTYVSEPVFENLSWEIHDDRCVGLIGPNGCGKSTLLRLIAGELTSDTGFTVRRKGLTISYLHQEPRLGPGRTVWQETVAASTELARVEAELARVEARLADPDVYGDEKALTRVLDRQARLLDEYTQLGGPGYEGRVRSTLHSLGFTDADMNLPVEALSGGQKKLVGLARLLVTQPDLLLLDEPDNHLDLEGKAFLERFIRGYKGAVIIVSHDRYLLDLVADEIVEPEGGRLTHYPGSYSEYAFEKQMRMLRQQRLYQAQQKEVKRLEQAAKRLLTWGKVYDNEKFSRRGRNILKRLDKMERVERPVLERKRMGLALDGWRGSNKVLEIVDLDKVFPADPKGFEGKPLGSSDEAIILAGLNLLLWRGERVGMVGPNGAGKSLLFRLILNQETISGGEIKIGPSVKVGYYAQEHETLDYERTLIDTVRQAAKLSEEGAVRFLGRFLFSYEQARGLVANLSGGERSRLQMALLMLSDANFLLLDEPTNNLDIPSAEVLEDTLADFEGTVFVISHDRYFLDRVVDHIVELDEGSLTEYLGGYSDYQAAKATQ
ncbi:MAG: ABC-F family ATP-binding cassette domain-containing protein [Anaerolineae bacterium]|nr:ABC-F family ATP-binding cassette domain-containing protein [Anaerolineae bacterium]MCK4448984.1 ABC-F family ATP-binding cassette domain-containing protein [Anaerolineae bacterium]